MDVFTCFRSGQAEAKLGNTYRKILAEEEMDCVLSSPVLGARRRLISARHRLDLLCVKQTKLQRHNPSLERDREDTWRTVMRVLLTCFEKHAPDVPKVAMEAEDRLQKELGESLLEPGHVRVRIMTKEAKDEEQERNRVVLVQLNDQGGTVVVVRVVRRRDLLSLRSLAAARVASCVRGPGEVEQLEVPGCLYPDIRRHWSEEWRVASYSRYLYLQTCCLGCAALNIAQRW